MFHLPHQHNFCLHAHKEKQVDVGGDKLKAAHEKKGAVAGPPRRCSSWRKVFADSKAKAHGDTPLHRAAGAQAAELSHLKFVKVDIAYH